MTISCNKFKISMANIIDIVITHYTQKKKNKGYGLRKYQLIFQDINSI